MMLWLASIIGRTWVLWCLLLGTVALSAGFKLWMPGAGGVLLDGQLTAEAARQLLMNMTEPQKAVHIRITLLLDMPYPFFYAGLSAGITLRAFGPGRWWFALPAMLAIPSDLFENVIQLLALAGDDRLLGIKDVLTPFKYLLVLVASAVSLAGLIRMVLARRRTGTDTA